MEAEAVLSVQLKLNKSPEIPALTGLRCFAALFVCMAHCLPRMLPENQPLHGLYLIITQLSAEGMTLFFVLSGFVIHYNYSRAIIKNPGIGIYNFIAARFARLWPLYLLCLLIDLVITLARTHSVHSLFNEALPYYLTLTQSWFYHPIGVHALVYQFGSMPSVAWSISTEWFFYLVYPLVCFGLYKAVTTRSKLFILAAISALTILAITAFAGNEALINQYAVKLFGNVADSHSNYEDSFSRWLIYFSPYSRLSEFIIGCATAALYMQLAAITPTRKEQLIGFVLGLTAVLGVIASHYFIFTVSETNGFHWLLSFHQSFGFAPAFAVLIYTSARFYNPITRFLSNRFILFGGEISYSMYLFHPVIIGICVRLLSKFGGHANLKSLVTLACIIGGASLSYKFIETPSRRLLRRWLMLKKPATEPHPSLA
jgi:peptidoglycan/LPS O-acetylase OafA/YrhL